MIKNQSQLRNHQPNRTQLLKIGTKNLKKLNDFPQISDISSNSCPLFHQKLQLKKNSIQVNFENYAQNTDHIYKLYYSEIF